MRQAKWVVVVLVTVALGLALGAVPVLAFDARSGDSVTMGSGEVVNEDAYLAGRTIISDATVNGDVFAAGQTVTVGGMVENGVTAAGQTVLVTGAVGHGVRAAGSTVDITGHVGRDVMAGCSILTVAESAVIEGDLAAGADTALIIGDVRGDLLGAIETLTIEGSIGGNVTLAVGTLELKPGASIEGNLKYSSDNEAVIPPGIVKGTVDFTRIAKEEAREGVRTGFGAIAPLAFFAGVAWKLLTFVMAFITGLILILLFPRRMSGSASAIRTTTGAAAGFGAIALFATPVAAVAVCITVVGIPLGIITLLLWGILLYLSQLPVALFIGHLIIGARKPLEGKGLMIGALALGLLLLALVRAIPFVGFLFSLAIALFGLGGFVVNERRMVGRHGETEL